MTFKKLRRSGRISKSVPILLMGSDTEGRVFSEETRTVILSLHGAGIVSSHKLLAEQELILRSLETNREVEVRVVGEIGEQGDHHMYGVAFLDEASDLWQMQFPAPPPLAERPLELDLECTACGATVALLNSDYEFDVCAIHGGLVRYCTECGFATVWKRPEPGMPSTAARAKPEPQRPRVEPRVLFAEQEREREELGLESVAESLAAQVGRLAKEKPRLGGESPKRDAGAQPLIETRATATAVEDRRGRVRAKVNYFACVKSDIVWTRRRDVHRYVARRIGIPHQQRISGFDRSDDCGSVFAGVAQRASDFCRGARGKYPAPLGAGDVPLRRDVFAGAGCAGALVRKLSRLARLSWLARNRNSPHKSQGLCRQRRADTRRAVRGDGWSGAN